MVKMTVVTLVIVVNMFIVMLNAMVMVIVGGSNFDFLVMSRV